MKKSVCGVTIFFSHLVSFRWTCDHVFHKLQCNSNVERLARGMVECGCRCWRHRHRDSSRTSAPVTEFQAVVDRRSSTVQTRSVAVQGHFKDILSTVAVDVITFNTR